jgi:hypothetical protein
VGESVAEDKEGATEGTKGTQGKYSQSRKDWAINISSQQMLVRSSDVYHGYQ